MGPQDLPRRSTPSHQRDLRGLENPWLPLDLVDLSDPLDLVDPQAHPRGLPDQQAPATLEDPAALADQLHQPDPADQECSTQYQASPDGWWSSFPCCPGKSTFPALRRWP